jgi:hypothetical protein
MASVGHRIIGFGNDRSPHDFYPTHRIAIEPLLQRETFVGPIWEPAAGTGAISSVLIEHGYDVISTDRYEYGYCEGGVDFLDATTNLPKVASIVTNPPFCHAQQFVERALEATTDKVALLLRLNFLEGNRRKAMFESTPLEKVYVFSFRLPFMRPRATVKAGMITFAWFLWKHGYRGEPIIRWIGDPHQAEAMEGNN